MGFVVTVSLAALALAFVLWPLWGETREDEAPETSATERLREALEQEKREALAAIREAEFDVAMGKIDAEDFELLRRKYAARALAALEKLDQWSSAPHYEPSTIRFCPSCGRPRPQQGRFCPSCGRVLVAGLAEGSTEATPVERVRAAFLGTPER